jgi:SAM-dependent MidA family methyltransferase
MQLFQSQYLRKSFGEEIDFFHANALDDAFVFANEIFDAFPCEIFHNGKIAGVENFHVTFAREDSNVRTLAETYGIQRGEICLEYAPFAQKLAQIAATLEYVSFDYGQREHRNCITARTYKAHQTLPLFDEKTDLKSLYQVADLTYDVHFDYLIDCFKRAGFTCEEFCFQANALVNFGLPDLIETLQKHVPNAVYQSEINKIKTLIDPHFMGERFKMVHFRRCA